MLNIVVLVSGGGTNLQAIINAIENGTLTNTKISAVISNNKGAYALERAKINGISACCISPKDFLKREEFYHSLLEMIKSFTPDLIVLAGYLVTIPKKIVETYSDKIINIHPSLIPAFCGTGYYGLKVHEAVLQRGTKITGATIHFVDNGTDTGPIILQQSVLVKEDDTPSTLQKRVMEEAEWKILPQAIHLIANGRVKIIKNKVIIEQ